MTIQVELKTKYGNDLIYPVCDTAKLLCELAGSKTFTAVDIDIIKKLGYTIDVVQSVKQL